MWHYLRDPTFSCFDTIPSVTDTHTRTDTRQPRAVKTNCSLYSLFTLRVHTVHSCSYIVSLTLNTCVKNSVFRRSMWTWCTEELKWQFFFTGTFSNSDYSFVSDKSSIYIRTTDDEHFLKFIKHVLKLYLPVVFGHMARRGGGPRGKGVQESGPPTDGQNHSWNS